MHTTIYSISESPKDKNVIWWELTMAICSLLAMALRAGTMWPETFPAFRRTPG
jgi:hypothetical protein